MSTDTDDGTSAPNSSLPRIVSVDDHVLEPPDLWQRHLPARWQDGAPVVKRVKGAMGRRGRTPVFELDDDGAWADCWFVEDLIFPISANFVATSLDDEEVLNQPVTFDQMTPGCYEQAARLVAMDENHTEASLCFPTFARFCGQTFLERQDRELALACVRAYNDWMIDEWCAGEGFGRLIPLTLVPLWDAELAAAEVRRCADKGSHAIAFTEDPVALDLPSVHTDDWDPLWRACVETDTVVNMHIGSSSKFVTTSEDAPGLVAIGLTFQGSLHGFTDWLSSGVLERFPELRIAFSEGQVGWMPYMLERLDSGWDRAFAGVGDRLTKPPSAYMPDRVFGCVFDDVAGLRLRDAIGMTQIMFEVDYPHADSTWPNTLAVVEHIIEAAALSADEAYQLLRGNAIRCYGLERFGIDR